MVTRTLYASGSSGTLMIVDSSVSGSALESLAQDPFSDLAKIRFHSKLNYLDIQDEVSGTVTFPAFNRNVNFTDEGCNSYNLPVPTAKVQTLSLGSTSVSSPQNLLLEVGGEVYSSAYFTSIGTNWHRQIYAAVSGSTVQLISVGNAVGSDMPSTQVTAKVYVVG